MIWIAVLAAVAATVAAIMKQWKIGPFLPQNQPELPPEPSISPNTPTMPSLPQTTPTEAYSPQISPSERVYRAAVALLGQHLTLNAAVPAEYGCAEAVSFVLVRCGYPIPALGLPTVDGLIAWMEAHGFVEDDTPSAGCVITAHSPQIWDASFAHCGIVMEHGVCSNTSATGLWTENYESVAIWLSTFSSEGSHTRFFCPV